MIPTITEEVIDKILSFTKVYAVVDKKRYQKTFEVIEKIDEKIRTDHFEMSFEYIDVFGELRYLNELLALFIPNMKQLPLMEKTISCIRCFTFILQGMKYFLKNRCNDKCIDKGFLKGCCSIFAFYKDRVIDDEPLRLILKKMKRLILMPCIDFDSM